VDFGGNSRPAVRLNKIFNIYRRRQFLNISDNKKSPYPAIKKAPITVVGSNRGFFWGRESAASYSPTQFPRAVPSALKGLTSVFGMETGVSPSLSPPKFVMYHHQNAQLNLNLWLSRTAD
jgi:hypothetical protein